MRKLLGVVLASAVLLGSAVPVNAGELALDKKPGSRHVQGGKKKHGQKKGLNKSAKGSTKKGAKSQAKKGSAKGKKHGKIKA